MKEVHRMFIQELAASCFGIVYHEPDYMNYLPNEVRTACDVYVEINPDDNEVVSINYMMASLFSYYLKETGHANFKRIEDLKISIPSMTTDDLIVLLIKHDMSKYIDAHASKNDLVGFMYFNTVNSIISQEIINRYEQEILTKFDNQSIDYKYVMSIIETIESKVLQQGVVKKSHLLYALESCFCSAFNRHVLLEVKKHANSIENSQQWQETISQTLAKYEKCFYQLGQAVHAEYPYRILRKYYNKGLLFVRDLVDSLRIMCDWFSMSNWERVERLLSETKCTMAVHGAQVAGRLETIKILKENLFHSLVASLNDNGNILALKVLRKQIDEIIYVVRIYSGKNLRCLLKILLAKEKAYADLLFAASQEKRQALLEFSEKIKYEVCDKAIRDREDLDRAYIREHDQALLEYVEGLVGQLCVSRSRSISPRDVSAIHDVDFQGAATISQATKPGQKFTLP